MGFLNNERMWFELVVVLKLKVIKFGLVSGVEFGMGLS